MNYEFFVQEQGKPEGYGTYYVEHRDKVMKGWYGYEEVPEYIFKRYWKEYQKGKMRWEELRWDFKTSEAYNLNIADFFRKHVNKYRGGTLADVQGADMYVVKNSERADKDKDKDDEEDDEE